MMYPLIAREMAAAHIRDLTVQPGRSRLAALAWFCCHQLFAVLWRFGRRRTGLADVAALGRAFLGRALVGVEARGRSPLCWPLPGRAG